MMSYLPCFPSCVVATKARPKVAITVSFVLDFGSDMWVCSKGIQLVDPSVCFLRGPKVHRARVDAWLAKEELAVGLFVTPELWRWLFVTRGSLMQTALIPLVALGRRQLLVLICKVVSLVLHCNINVSFNEYSIGINIISFVSCCLFFFIHFSSSQSSILSSK